MSQSRGRELVAAVIHQGTAEQNIIAGLLGKSGVRVLGRLASVNEFYSDWWKPEGESVLRRSNLIFVNGNISPTGADEDGALLVTELAEGGYYTPYAVNEGADTPSVPIQGVVLGCDSYPQGDFYEQINGPDRENAAVDNNIDPIATDAQERMAEVLGRIPDLLARQ